MTVTHVDAERAEQSKSLLSEHGRDEDIEKIATCTVSQATFNTFFYMFAAAQVPYALAQAGWMWGITLLVVLSVISVDSGFVLTRICTEKKAYSWKDVSMACGGPAAKVFIECVQVFAIFFTSMVQTQGGGSAWQLAFPDAPLCLWKWILINAIPYFIFLQIPSFSGSSMLKLATVLCLIGTVWRVAMYTYAFLAWGAYPYKCYSGQNISTIFNGCASLMGTFGVKVCLPEMIREMKIPSDFNKAWRNSQMIVMPLYFLVGVVGFALFGTFTTGGLMNNFKDTAAFNVYFIAAPLLGMLPATLGQILLFLKVELFLGVLPCDWWTVSNPQNNRCPSIPPVIFRLLFRGGVLAVWLFLGLLLIGFPVMVLFGLICGTTSAAFSFYLPYVFGYMAFHKTMGTMKKIWYVTAALLSIGLSGLGLYSTLTDFANIHSVKPFAFKDTCNTGGFVVGQFHGNNHHDQNGGYSNATGPGTFHDTIYAGTCYGNINCGQAEQGAACGVCGWASNTKKMSVTCTGCCSCDVGTGKCNNATTTV